MYKLSWFVAILLAVFCGGRTYGAEADFNPQPDKALLKKIKALPDNTWFKLPPIKVAGDLAWLSPKSDYRRMGPRVRDYCNKIVYAPQRKRGIYCGAGHNIHPYNDVWEYDLASNTWICLYGADPLLPKRVKDQSQWPAVVEKARSYVVYKDGVIRTKRGGPVRPAHTWWGLAYDIHRKRMIFWDAHKGLMFTNRKAIGEVHGLEIGGKVLKGSGSGPGEAWIFEFDPAGRKWTNVIKDVPKSYESSQLEYLSASKSLLLMSGWIYRQGAEPGTWEKGTKWRGGNAVSAYDPETDKVVAVRGSNTHVYDCRKKTFETVYTDNDLAQIPNSALVYDTHAKEFILITSRVNKAKSLTGPRLSRFSLASGKWTMPPAQGDPLGKGAFAAYYDEARNVTVYYNSRGTWVYRCKR